MFLFVGAIQESPADAEGHRENTPMITDNKIEGPAPDHHQNASPGGKLAKIGSSEPIFD